MGDAVAPAVRGRPLVAPVDVLGRRLASVEGGASPAPGGASSAAAPGAGEREWERARPMGGAWDVVGVYAEEDMLVGEERGSDSASLHRLCSVRMAAWRRSRSPTLATPISFM